MPDVDFHSAYRDSTRGSTLKALQLRQRELQDLMAQTQAPRRIEHPAQAFGQMAQTLSAGIREGRAASQEAAGRQRFAELLAGGLTADEMGEALGIDPETAMKYQENTWATEKEARAAAARAGELRQGHDWDVEAATARVAAEKAAAEERARVEAESQGRTFEQQDKTAEELAREQEAAKTIENQRKLEQDKLNAQQAQEQAGVTAALGSPEAELREGLKRGTITQSDFDAGMANMRAKAAKEGMTPGQTKLEQDYATEHGEWTSTGRAQSISNLQQLQKAATSLGKERSWFSELTGFGAPSGVVTGLTPDTLNRFIGNQDAVNTRDAVRAVAQESLKAVLGTQFAAVEGQQVLERAFDPYARPEENQRRIGLLAAKLQQIANQREAKAEYWNKNGMISGYVGPSLDEAKADFLSLMNEFDAGPAGAPPDTNSGAGANAPAQPELTDEQLLEMYRPKPK